MNCAQNNIFTIFTGDAKPMNLKAVYAQSFDPLDLTSCTEIVVNIPNADGTFSQFSLSGAKVSISSPPVLGNFVVSAAAVGLASGAFNVGELQSFTAVFTISGQKLTVPYVNALSVFAST